MLICSNEDDACDKWKAAGWEIISGGAKAPRHVVFWEALDEESRQKMVEMVKRLGNEAFQ